MLAIIADYTYRPFLAYPDKLERAVYLLLFLFPIAGMSVRHWISNVFILFFLMGLFSIRRKSAPLLKEEKYFICICAAYFMAFLISALLNGWGKPQTYYLGTELRFIAVIPVFLLLRNFKDCSEWFLRGVIIAGFVLLAQACYDLYKLNLFYAHGVYSKNLIGPFAILVAFWILYFAWSHRVQLNLVKFYILAAAVLCALITASMSGSRGAYLAFIVLSIFCTIFFAKPRWMFLGVFGMFIIAFTLYHNIAHVQRGVDTAYHEVVGYYQAEDHVTDKSSITSIGVRLEMWRTSWLFLKDNFVFGLGPQNYLKNAKEYIENGDVNPIIVKYPNPHNAFLEATTSKGMLGLITLLLLLYYPAYIYIRDYKIHKATAVIGLIHIIAITIFSFSDHSVIVKNNYASIFLLGMALYFSTHINQIRETKRSHD